MHKALYVIHFSILPLLGPVLSTSLQGFPVDNLSLQLRAEYDAHVINFLVLVSTQSCVLLPALFPFHFVSRTHPISKYLSFSISTNSLHFPSILPTFQLGWYPKLVTHPSTSYLMTIVYGILRSNLVYSYWLRIIIKGTIIYWWWLMHIRSWLKGHCIEFGVVWIDSAIVVWKWCE